VNPENSPFVSGFAGTARVRVVSVPAFCWVQRAATIRDFILLYRDIATSEHNTWAVAHLDGLLEKVGQLEARSNLAWKSEIPKRVIL